MKNIYLIGFMGSGKSAVGSALAQLLGMECMEMDEYIQRQQERTITEIFAACGEEYFRTLETEVLQWVAGKEGMVVSCGGGSVLREENVALMKRSGRIVLLTAEPETIYARVRYSRNRPVLNGNMTVAYIAGLMEQRRGCYTAAADFAVATDGKSIQEICNQISGELKQGDKRREG